MTIDSILVALVGFVLGYIFITFLLVFPRKLAEEGIAILKANSLTVAGLIIKLAAYGFTQLIFWGIAEIWIIVLAQGDWARNLQLAKIWGQWWFIGFVLSFVIPALERRFKDKSKRSGVAS